ncbi:hypothetical protein ACFFWC_24600 [Plantactinospora siamensis]|uniref:Uncharacterized protein n=1 Tax=Plantactinospora siamensis TaxID=555372 RepID=A0ABV6P6J4_9ACTN
MSIIASVPAPTGANLAEVDTVDMARIPRIPGQRRPQPAAPPRTLVEIAAAAGVTPYEAFRAGIRLHDRADVHALAASLPPETAERRAEREITRTEVLTWPVERLAREWRISLATAADVRALYERTGR